MTKNIEEVRQFWEANPLWSGESHFSPGTQEFFEEHRQVYIEDCFAGELDKRIFPNNIEGQKILDLGCGPGFWTVEFGLRGCQNITAADLTLKAVELTQQRCKIYGLQADLSQQNAEHLTFADASFSHVNCQGVIHHTPNTDLCVKEIARVLNDEGTAIISVYYKNIFLRSWKFLKFPASLLGKLGGGLKGRGREQIYQIDDVNEIVRLYDGVDNPIGKAYSRKEFSQMLSPYFEIQDVWIYFFPARTLPFSLPNFIHSILDKSVGFMIMAKLKKR
jgi:2-polyprenyl-3-methyl-5-hydroxy-6-metoxy-1,4-benzoquinol methylase